MYVSNLAVMGCFLVRLADGTLHCRPVTPNLSSLHDPFKTNEIFHKETYNKARMIHCKTDGTQVIISKNIEFVSLKIEFVLANSAEPG